jgi:hypothetical protein
LALAACSDDDSGSDTESGSDAAVEEEQVQAIPVATDFFEETPEWSVSVPADSQVLQLGEHVVWYSPETGSIGAYDASGAEAWTEQIESFAVEENDLYFRVVDTQTVAVIQLGQSESEGLDAGGSVFRVWLYDVASGPAGEPVDVPGERLEPAEYGLAFTVLDVSAPTPLEASFTVSAAGEATEHQPVSDTLAGTPVAQTPTMTVGDVPVFGIAGVPSEDSTYGTIEGDFHEGFGGEGWNSMDIAPPSAANGGTAAHVLAVAAGDHYLTARWFEPTTTGESSSAEVFGLVDVASGELVTELSCEGETSMDQFEAPIGRMLDVSADGRYFVTKWSVIDAQTGEVHCLESERRVVLRAVDGQGRAFGDIDVDEEGAEAVMVGVDGEATTAPTAAGVYAPLGFLEGDLAVHYDSDSGVVTANRLKV